MGREEGLREEGQKGNPEGVKEEGQEKTHAFIYAYACMLLRGQVCAGSYFVLFSFVHTPMGRALYGKGRKQKLRKERLRPCSQLALNIGILLRWVLRGGSWATTALLARNTYRNFQSAEDREWFAGFRTCADAQTTTST